MKRKLQNVYAFKILQSIEQDKFVHNEHLRGDRLASMLEHVRKLPVDIEKGYGSRYSNIGTSEERCLVFLDEIDSNFAVGGNFIPALFLKRRGASRPFEEDGHGNLIELKLSNEINEIAEIAYLLFLVDEGILLWIFNPFVGGNNQLTDYLTNMIVRSNSSQEKKFEFKQMGLSSELKLAYIIYPDALSDFENKLRAITALEFTFAGRREDLVQAFLTESTDIGEIELMRHFVKTSNCGSFSFNLHAERMSKKKKKDLISPSLSKIFISALLGQTSGYLKKNQKSKFIVHGKTIDEETKVLDLINSKLIYEISIEYDAPTVPVAVVFSSMLILARSKSDEMKVYLK